MSTNPSTTAISDQLAMYTRKDLDRYVQAIPGYDAEIGEVQSGADFTAYLVREHTPDYLAILVIAAIRRIRALEKEQEART